jgi:hypothetical protein
MSVTTSLPARASLSRCAVDGVVTSCAYPCAAVQMPLMHRVLMNIGCVARLSDEKRKQLMSVWAGGRRVDPLSEVLTRLHRPPMTHTMSPLPVPYVALLPPYRRTLRPSSWCGGDRVHLCM